MELTIHKSRKKAFVFIVAGIAAGIAAGPVMRCARDTAAGWCLILTAVFTLLYGIGTLCDRSPYLILTERGILETHTLGEEIEWEAVLRADDFYFRGQDWVRLLLDRNDKPQFMRPSMFRRFDRLYDSKRLKAVYIGMLGLEFDSARLTALIREMIAAAPQQRTGLLQAAKQRGGRSRKD